MINLLITGGAGFIGSNLVDYWINKNPLDNVVVLDKLTYAGNRSNIERFINNSNFDFIEGDICNNDLVTSILSKYKITHIAHLEEESHVDRSISLPEIFINTNIYGTYILLEAFRKHWINNGKPIDYRFLHVSTDEVFGALGINDKPFNESSSYKPRSPYSASKASSDHMVKAWFETYKLPIIVSNCSNNYGPFQYPEKLIPLTIINILLGKNIPIYGKGNNIRDWLHVQDHCNALEMILKSNFLGETFCIGGSNEKSNASLINMICDFIEEMQYLSDNKNIKSLIKYVPDRAGHDFRYSIDSSKIRTKLGWSSTISFEEGIKNTINWYFKKQDWWVPLLNKEYKNYIEKQYPEVS